MATSKTDRLAMLQKQLEQSEKNLAALRSAVKAENTKIRNGQLMAWGEALEAAYLAASDERQKSHIENMILGALKGEGAKVKMWRKRAAEGFARLKGVEQPAEPQKSVETPQTPQEVKVNYEITIPANKIPMSENQKIMGSGARFATTEAGDKIFRIPPGTNLVPFASYLEKPLSEYQNNSVF